MSLYILLHSSKTMRRAPLAHAPLGEPQLLPQAQTLVGMWHEASLPQFQSHMKISSKKASDVQQLYNNWSSSIQTPAIDAFIGDIYSGLQTNTWADDDRAYAHNNMLILSGLYGGLRACDGVMPYRLEMGYKLPNGRTMYDFWGDAIATLLPASTQTIINLSAVEYTKAILPYTNLPVITPKFLTISPKTGEPTFVTVHTKIARGAFARWLIQHRIQDTAQLRDFTDLGYAYNAAESTPEQPVFICKQFGGIGLSVRLQS